MAIKPSTIIKPSFVAYFIVGGKVKDLMTFGKDCGGYNNRPCQELIDDGWNYICETKKYTKGQKVKVKIWPTSQEIERKKIKDSQTTFSFTCNVTAVQFREDKHPYHRSIQRQTKDGKLTNEKVFFCIHPTGNFATIRDGDWIIIDDMNNAKGIIPRDYTKHGYTKKKKH